MSSDLNRQTFKTNYRLYMENIRTQKKWNSDISVFSNQATHVTVTVVLLCIYQNSLSHTDIPYICMARKASSLQSFCYFADELKSHGFSELIVYCKNHYRFYIVFNMNNYSNNHIKIFSLV